MRCRPGFDENLPGWGTNSTSSKKTPGRSRRFTLTSSTALSVAARATTGRITGLPGEAPPSLMDMQAAKSIYSLLAAFVLLAHFAFVAFVALGLLVIWVGYFCGWPFVRDLRFRLAHLLATRF